MKLILSIVSNEDAEPVSVALKKAGYSSTRLDSTGGFLKVGNAVLLIGVDDLRVRDVLRVIEDNAHARDIQLSGEETGGIYKLPSRMKAGAAVVFVLDVDQFYKL